MKYYKSFISIIVITIVIIGCTEKNFTLNSNDNNVVTFANNDKKILEEDLNISSSQIGTNEEFKKFSNSIKQYIVELENLLNKNSYYDDKKFLDLQKQLFIELNQLNKNIYTQDERVLDIINSLSQNYKSNDSYYNSDLKILKDYLEILLKKEQDISSTKDKSIQYYIESVKNSKENFEYFTYFVGVILIFIGTLIFFTVRVLGVWQRDKINTYEERIELLRERIEKVLDREIGSNKEKLEKEMNNNKDEFKNLKISYEKEIQTYESRVKKLEEAIAINQDLRDTFLYQKINIEDYIKVINKHKENIAEEKNVTGEFNFIMNAEEKINIVNETNDPFNKKEENGNV